MHTNAQLQLANDFVEYTGQHVFLTGKAGTGKTTFLRKLKERSPKRMIVVAPTGVAAINAGGMTIHSFFQLSFAPQVGKESENARKKHFTKHKISIMRTLDLLVIDEISMVRADVLDAIDKVLQRYRRNNKPFGGVQLLMIGDLQQLAPVVKNDEWNILRTVYDSAFFFSSKALSRTSYVSIELTHVYRQRDDHFINILNKVRDNCLDQAAADALNTRYIPNFEVPAESDYITLCTHNAKAKQINDEELSLLPGKEYTIPARVKGNFPEYAYPTDEKLHLKKGAQVMFVKNDPDPEKRFFNGKIGKITHLSEDEIRVISPGETNEISVTPLLWENVKYSIDAKTAEIKEETEGTFEQIPLKTAWAITIHKSQGLTFEHAVIDAQASFAHGQVYVALSRCKTLEGMVLSSPIDERSIINDKRVNGFIHHVEENQPNEKQLKQCRNAYKAEVLTEMFNFSRPLYLLRGLLRVVHENSGTFPDKLAQKIENINVQASQHLVQVAVTFDKEIKRLIAENPDVSNNALLQERISKGVAYFDKKTKTLLSTHFKSLNVEIDNKTVNKTYKRYLTELEDDIEIKRRVFEVCKSGFSLEKILDIRAKSTLANEKASPRKEKKNATYIPEDVEHPELYHALRLFRKEKADENNAAAFHVFSQKTLAELAKYLPDNEPSLKNIKGLGVVKIRQFGTEILEIIQDYCREKNIDRQHLPEPDIKKEKKKKAPKENTKQISFDLYKKGKTIPQIAEERALKENTIEGHLAAFVTKGELEATDFVEKAKLEQMKHYFKQTQNHELKKAKAHFKDQFTYGELRIGLSDFLSTQQ